MDNQKQKKDDKNQEIYFACLYKGTVEQASPYMMLFAMGRKSLAIST